MGSDADSAAKGLIGALANARRLDIVRLVGERERSVSELSRALGLSQSALSQHLGRLRREGVVSTRRDGVCIYYRAADPDALALAIALGTLAEKRRAASQPADGQESS